MLQQVHNEYVFGMIQIPKKQIKIFIFLYCLTLDRNILVCLCMNVCACVRARACVCLWQHLVIFRIKAVY